MPDLKEVIARLEGATGPNDALNREVCIATGIAPRIEAPFDAAGRGVEIYPPVMWSVDAALAFVKRVLPGVHWQIAFDPEQRFWVGVGQPGEREDGYSHYAPSPSS